MPIRIETRTAFQDRDGKDLPKRGYRLHVILREVAPDPDSDIPIYQDYFRVRRKSNYVIAFRCPQCGVWGDDLERGDCPEGCERADEKPLQLVKRRVWQCDHHYDELGFIDYERYVEHFEYHHETDVAVCDYPIC